MIALTMLRQFWPFLVIAALTASTWYYRTSLRTAEAQLAAVEAVGKAQEQRNKEIEDEWKTKVTRAQGTATAANRKLNDWMRQHASGSSALPASSGTPAGTDRAGQICFDEAQLDGAIRRFIAGIQGIVGDGQAAVIDSQAILDSWPSR